MCRRLRGSRTKSSVLSVQAKTVVSNAADKNRPKRQRALTEKQALYCLIIAQAYSSEVRVVLPFSPSAIASPPLGPRRFPRMLPTKTEQRQRPLTLVCFPRQHCSQQTRPQGRGSNGRGAERQHHPDLAQVSPLKPTQTISHQTVAHGGLPLF